MTDHTSDLYDAAFRQMIHDASTNYDLSSQEGLAAMKTLKAFAEVRGLLPEEPEPTPAVPETRRGKLKLFLAQALDNETARTIIKVAGPLAGVGLVTYTTIHRDHVIQKEALNQANQRQY